MESLLEWSGWGSEAGHVCALYSRPSRYSQTPTRGLIVRMWNSAARCLLPCSWHHGSRMFLRSHKALQLEKKRQMSLRCWFVVHPYSPFKFYWDCFNMALFTINCFYMPCLVFFHCPDPYDKFILFNDAMTFLSIIINFFTGRLDGDDKIVTLEVRKISRRYRRGTFFCDLLAALPLQCIQLSVDCTLPTHTVFYGVKLLRLIFLEKAWNNLSTQFDLSYVMSVMITVLVRTLIFFHWMTYVHYQVPVLSYHIQPDSLGRGPWLARVKAILHNSTNTVHEISGPLDRYTTNLYFVSGFCIGASVYSSNHQQSMYLPEQILVSIMSLAGLLFMTYAFTAVLRLVVYRHFETYLFNGRLKELHAYFALRRLPRRLQRKVQLYINYFFNGHYFNEDYIRNTINVQIKQEINMYCCKKLVINVPLFQNMPIAVINAVIFSLVQVLYMPGEIVVKYGEPGSSIYLIASGTVAIMNAEGKEVGHLKDGAFFGERSLLKPGTLRNATIVALEITEIYKLNHAQLQACLQPVPRAPRRSASSPPPPPPPPPPHRDTIHSLSPHRDTVSDISRDRLMSDSMTPTYTEYYFK